MLISQTDASGTPQFFLHDGHGSTRALLDLSAQEIEKYAYDAFGESLYGTGLTLAKDAATTWLFANDGQYDPTNGLVNHIARWRQGHRFIGLDPFAGVISDPLSLHKYLYVHGDPVQGIDPSGLMSLSERSVVSGIQSRLASLAGRSVSAAARLNRQVFGVGGRTLGNYFQQLGRIADKLANRALEAFRGSFRTLRDWPSTARFPDKYISVTQGPFKGFRLIFEYTWRLDKFSGGFARKVAQITEFAKVANGLGKARVVVWTLQPTSRATQQAVLGSVRTAVDPRARVVFVEGISGLFEYLKLLFWI